MPLELVSRIQLSETDALHVPLPDVLIAAVPPVCSIERFTGVIAIIGSCAVGGFGAASDWKGALVAIASEIFNAEIAFMVFILFSLLRCKNHTVNPAAAFVRLAGFVKVVTVERPADKCLSG